MSRRQRPTLQAARDHFFRRLLPIYWIFLFCSTHFPKLTLPGGVPQSDKIVHFVTYGVLAALFWKCAETFRRPLPDTFVWLALGMLTAYAAFDELTQPLVNRTASVDDFRADVLGVFLVLFVLEGWRRRF
jgi:VanZ family protein